MKLFLAAVFSILISSLFIGTRALADAEFMAEIKLLNQKSGKCLIEIKTKGSAGEFCKDLTDYTQSIFKGSSETYFSYHMDDNDINKSNEKYVIGVMKRMNAALRAAVNGNIE